MAGCKKRVTDPLSIKMFIDNFEWKILLIREESQETIQNLEKRRKTDISELNREAKEICDIIICQIKDRFTFSRHLIVATLFLPEMFPQYDPIFPEKNVNETCKVYTFIDINKLKTELSLIYT